MSDIKCRVCGEPWDYYGARTGDMKWWEFELFRKGGGCPCCQGESDLDQDTGLELHLRSVVFGGTDEPDIFEELHNVDGAPRPEWREPEESVVWKCDGCGVKVVRSNERPYNCKPDDPQWLEWGTPLGGRARYWNRAVEQEPYAELEMGGDTFYFCDECASHCDECGEVVVTASGDWVEAAAMKSPESSDYYNPDWVCSECYFTVADRVQREAIQEDAAMLLGQYDIDDPDEAFGELWICKVTEWLESNDPGALEFCEGGNSPSEASLLACFTELGWLVDVEDEELQEEVQL